MQLLFDRSEELEPSDGLGLISGSRDAARGARASGFRTSAGTRSCSSVRRRSPSGLPAGGCAFYHVHSFVARPSDERDVVGDHQLRRAVCDDRRPRQRVRSPVPPREVVCTRPADARAASSRSVTVPRRRPLRSRRCGHDPAAGDRHPRRQGGAPDPRGLRPAHDAMTPIRCRPRSGGSTAAPARCTSSTSTAPAAASRRTSSTSSGSSRASPVPVQVGGGLRTSGSVEAALEAGAARVVLGTAAFRDLDFLDEVARRAPRSRRGLDRRP